jgi:hypothetical protein
MSRYNMQPTGTTDIINILATEITGRSPSAQDMLNRTKGHRTNYGTHITHSALEDGSH